MHKIAIRPLVLTTLVLAAAFSRIVPHLPNFSPLNAIALFAAAHFTARTQAVALPLAATWLSDLYLNNVTYAQPNTGFVWGYTGMQWQYGAYLLIAVFGLWLFRASKSFWRTAVGVLASGMIFFLVSNFGVWASGNLYPPTAEGLLACYVAGLPFYQGTILGDLFYSTLLFGSFALAERKIPRLRAHMA